MISREAMLKPAPVPEKIVDLPEMGDGAQIRVVGMTVRERNEFEAQFADNSGKRIKARTLQVRERMVVAACKNADGTPMFTIADVPAIGKQPARVIERIIDAANELSGNAVDAVEQFEKNSEETVAD